MQNKLSTASITKITGEASESEWIVYSNTKEELWQLPKHLTEQEVMNILHFARKYETEAFNNGIEFTKKSAQPTQIKAQNNVILQLQAENKNLLKHNQAMFEENERIGGKLDELLTSKQ